MIRSKYFIIKKSTSVSESDKNEILATAPGEFTSPHELPSVVVSDDNREMLCECYTAGNPDENSFSISNITEFISFDSVEDCQSYLKENASNWDDE